ncbi:unnamed protein product [Rotaria sp. Silwood1]|nr:unnamed protein product [Rotaria sp. Silwood1]CAF3729887.1 unnamed protein product [Rotaria sp. Silwood1]CAF4846165.1 unnamed protein product [Rotaria sp. Silwood1]CAF4860717.1 unnamed protein product [Rotaria sp. Silwood1]CAF5045858.1 unnamed protein product [Rotaria sp. Silwood1]
MSKGQSLTKEFDDKKAKYLIEKHNLAILIVSFTKTITVASEKHFKNLSTFTFHIDTMKQYKSIRIDIDQTNKTLEQL